MRRAREDPQRAQHDAAPRSHPLTPHASWFSDCAMWTVYGLGIGDIWVWGPNSTGLGLGLVQLTLKVVFPSRPKRYEEQRNFLAKESCSDVDDDGGASLP